LDQYSKPHRKIFPLNWGIFMSSGCDVTTHFLCGMLLSNLFDLTYKIIIIIIIIKFRSLSFLWESLLPALGCHCFILPSINAYIIYNLFVLLNHLYLTSSNAACTYRLFVDCKGKGKVPLQALSDLEGG
jgi:hypothetical protein